MPELPEVETTRRGISPHLMGHTVTHLEIRERRMRWPVDDSVLQIIGHPITRIHRRAKYLLIDCETGTLILHLGMSGSIRICTHDVELKKHDHFIMQLDSHQELRLHDPRRFGAILWHHRHDGDTRNHPLLKHLGPEPLEQTFHANYLISTCTGRTTSIKQHIMNSKIVVGVGNIYACEALFRSGIHPTRSAGRISKPRLIKLTQDIKNVLTEAITQGGTTLRDFLREDGKPGYFKQKLNVYDRQGEPCRHCDTTLKKIVISNRSTYYCPMCQR
ncbi:MAG: bifunctional DNA-formamidopyrimidine glycosylase/DNA-(apurinic or apyrimidinic site) lyase [Verrucomicrobiae bacterium]|nr:bifunctional DNA-formamidopyrimidine glycosylase/DNA-(apurinic or apyrimidinic site) lyase [Verrucomicrobiae bacterium]NNJ41884.1 bifunctional DNA-formamidopyrimidine glycosylase/DNA-(apurinic or apyrimidinic site) lyase [Akkermansiaceae bacterium]